MNKEQPQQPERVPSPASPAEGALAELEAERTKAELHWDGAYKAENRERMIHWNGYIAALEVALAIVRLSNG